MRKKTHREASSRKWSSTKGGEGQPIGKYSADSLNKSTFESRRREKAARVQGLLGSDPRAERPLIRLQLLDCWMSCDSRKCLRPEIKKDREWVESGEGAGRCTEMPLYTRMLFAGSLR